MAEGKKSIFEEDKQEEAPLSAEDLKLMKQLDSCKVLDEKVVREAISITDPKYKWFIENLYDIDPKLGLVWKDYDQMSKQRGVLFHFLKQMGSNLLKGKSIMSVSLPIAIMEPLSMLQRLANVYAYFPGFAEKMYNEKDPIERMKMYVGFSIATLYIGMQQKKPLNPIWGETYEGYINNPSCRVYCEQTSHHPPVSQLIVETPHAVLHATHYVEAHTYPNSLKIKSLGEMKIIIKGEGQSVFIVRKKPEVHVGGILLGKRTIIYEGFMEIYDETNQLYAQARFNPEKQGFFERMFSKTTATRADFFKGFITKNAALLKDESRKAFYSKDMISYFEGQWLDYLNIDGECYWDIGREPVGKLFHIPDPLPSDSRFRADLRLLEEGKMEEAQTMKEELEDIQRRDRKLRADAAKAAKKH